MKEKITRINQIGIVTKDVKAMAKRYEEIYGIGPWVIADGTNGLPEKYQAADTMVNGKRSDFKITIAWANVGDMEIELIQPLDDESDYARFLREHGDGVHHISIDTDAPDFEKTMEDRKVDVLMSGRIPGKETWLYYNTNEELGMLLEIHDTDKK